ncbi:hypothetical protein DEO72_LG3g1752 [Vigna unguiculata]|uniref:Uncharacterized protein n=1 Tax=Vigna unguiculata TaxID=3917 RepID=A0A4D6LFF8_VIGUN|nr:hypothetical protein DEO72_LG3g1752 [Vigna unguiculata]
MFVVVAAGFASLIADTVGSTMLVVTVVGFAMPVAIAARSYPFVIVVTRFACLSSPLLDLL